MSETKEEERFKALLDDPNRRNRHYGKLRYSRNISFVLASGILALYIFHSFYGSYDRTSQDGGHYLGIPTWYLVLALLFLMSAWISKVEMRALLMLEYFEEKYTEEDKTFTTKKLIRDEINEDELEK